MERLHVVTWNVENLFAPNHDDDPDTQAEYEQKLDALAAVIELLDPDILALQEVGGQTPLDDLQTRPDSYPHAALGVPDGRGIRNAFLSRLAFTGDPRDITDFPSDGLAEVAGVDDHAQPRAVRSLGRGALHVVVAPSDGSKLHLVNVHLKSKLLSYPNFGRNRPRFFPRDENERARTAAFALLKRTAEATAIRVEANGVLEPDNGEALIVLGDFNDVPEAATTQIVKGPPGSEFSPAKCAECA